MLAVFQMFVSRMFLCKFLQCRFCSRSGVGRAFEFILTLVPAMSEIGPAGNYLGAFPGTKVCVIHTCGFELNPGGGGVARKSVISLELESWMMLNSR